MSARPEAVIVRTGVANVASVVAALDRLGVSAVVDDARDRVEAAELLVLPGVGSFGAGMRRLREAGLVEPLRARIRAGRPTLAMCLGLQLLGRASAETPGVAGLGVCDVEAAHFPDTVRAPQFGWNAVAPEAGDGLVAPGFAYFANSYRFETAPDGWRVSWAEHGGRFVAALERGAVLACQFHPEISGPWGAALMERWLITAREAVPC